MILVGKNTVVRLSIYSEPFAEVNNDLEIDRWAANHDSMSFKIFKSITTKVFFLPSP